MTRTPTSRSGFTLIELLVVIAVIAILAAILFPVFAKAREKARQTACTSNMKQIGLGIIQYVQDNDGYFPIVRWTTNPKFNWGQEIYPYVKSTQVFVCPSNTLAQTAPNSQMGPNFLGDPTRPSIPASYSMNDRLGSNPATTLHEGGLDSPSQKIIVAEVVPFVYNGSTNNSPNYAYWDWANTGTYGNGKSSWENFGYAGHTGFGNWLFFDGHVKALKPMATVVPLNMYGQFNGNVAADGPGCNAYSNTIGAKALNCDKTPAAVVTAVSALQSQYQ